MASRWDSSHVYIRGAHVLWRSCLRGCFGEPSLSVPFQVACSPDTGVVHSAGVERDIGSWNGLRLLTVEVSQSIALLRGTELSVCLLVEIGHFFIALQGRTSTSMVPRTEMCDVSSKLFPSLLTDMGHPVPGPRLTSALCCKSLMFGGCYFETVTNSFKSFMKDANCGKLHMHTLVLRTQTTCAHIQK